MSERSEAAATRIKEVVPILQVLASYGYRVRDDGGEREQQFSCDLHGTGRDTKPSARVYPKSGSWYCVAVGERVLTSQGWLTLQDLSSQQRPASYDGSSWQIPLAYLPRGYQPVVKVQTTAGYSVTVTPDHEIQVMGKGWIPASSLQRGDEVVVPKPVRPRFPCLDPAALRHIVEPLNQRRYRGYNPLALPTAWSTKLGEVMGYIFGDGWVVPRAQPNSGMVGITVHASDVQDVREDLFPFMQVWAGGRGSEHHSIGQVHVQGKPYREDQYEFTIGNDGFCSFFQAMGINKTGPANKRRLPESIWGAPECGVRGFLRGIFGADGSIYRPSDRLGVRVTLYSVSEFFLWDVQLLLLQFGIHSRVHAPSLTRVKVGQRRGALTHPAGYLQIATGKDIPRFRDLIGVASRRKQAVLDSYAYVPRGSRPFKALVKDVTPAGVAVVADLSMPVEHSFVAGGIKVHNCFGCDKTRDAIGTVMSKEGLKFWDAVAVLEKAFGLDPLPKDYGTGPDFLPQTERAVRAVLDPAVTFEKDASGVHRFLDNRTTDRGMTLDQLLRFWEKYDEIVFYVRGPRGDGGPWTEEKGRLALQGLMVKIHEACKGQQEGD